MPVKMMPWYALCTFSRGNWFSSQICGAAVLCPNWYMSNHLGAIFGTLPNSILIIGRTRVRPIFS